MPRVFYRLSGTADPEERLEDAALSKALFDVLGDNLMILPEKASFPDHGLHLGRGKNIEDQPRRQLSLDHIHYWEDPAFQAHTTRRWGIFDLEGAEAETARLQAEGKSVVVKSTLRPKDLVLKIDQDESFLSALGPMGFSYCDRPPCLMVQEAVDMRFERRFLVMNRDIVTQSAVGYHLTPLSRFSEVSFGQNFEDLHLETPSSRHMLHSQNLTDRMAEKAQEIAKESGFDHLCIDLCLIGEDMRHGVIEPIEFNPMNIGHVGLYGCDPYRIAEGVARYLELNPDVGVYREVAAAKTIEHDFDDEISYDF